jgi:TatD DNase family protein
MYIDSHCHLDRVDLKHFDNSFSTLIEKIKENQVSRMLCVSINLEDYTNMRKLVDAYDFIDVSAGVHPSDAVEHKTTAEVLEKLALDERVVAIGETGLDYFYGKDTKPQQQESFSMHIQVANKLNKPLIVHTRDAQKDTIDILKNENASNCGGVMHCFTENWEMAKQALDLGLYISFSGIVTFRNAEDLREVARKVPADRFLIETDSPYLAPVPNRGKKNYPGWVKHIAECLADVRSESLEDIARLSTDNYNQLFKSSSI